MKLISCTPDGYEVIADSAVVLPGRPTFIPDIENVSSWEARPMLAVRISRLGKSISRKFAPRFYDSITLALRLVPLAGERKPLAGITSVMDFGLTLGEWAGLTADMENISIDLNNGKFSAGNLHNGIAAAIEALSRHTTLKMGDLLLFPLPVEPVSASIGTVIAGAIDGHSVLEARFK